MSLRMQARLRCLRSVCVIGLGLLTGAAQGQSHGVADPALAGLLPGYPAVAAGVPADSDVLFSPRFDRPEALAAAQAFAATRLVWSYVPPGLNQARLRALVGGRFGGTLNNNQAIPGHAGAALDFEGQPIIAPWMKSWGAIWNSCARPATMQALKTSIDSQAAAGIAQMQFDDAGMQFDSAFWNVGDLSDDSQKGFGRWLQQRADRGERLALTPAQGSDYRQYLASTHGVRDTDDYVRRSAQFPSTPLWREYLRETVDVCLGQVRQWLRVAAGPEVALSVNLYTPYPWAHNRFQLRHADYVLGEVSPERAQAHHLLLFAQSLRSEGKRWAVVFQARDPAFLRRRVALAYAAGAVPVVPWDSFVPGDGKAAPTRHFGRVEDSGDLFRFVRDRPGLFEGWELLSRLTVLLPTDPAQPNRIDEQLQRLVDAQVPFAVSLLPAASPPRRLSASHPHWLAGAVRGGTPAATPLLAAQGPAALAELATTSAVSEGWTVWVKGQSQRPGVRVVHLIPDDKARASPQLTLKPWVLPPAARYEVVVHQPGVETSARSPVAVRPDGTLSLSLELARPGTWTVLEIKALAD
jgi:hypothetical protein